MLPGPHDQEDGRLRDPDRAALATVVDQGNDQRWQRIRAAARHVVTPNTEVSSWQGQPDPRPRLVKRLSEVRWMRVRLGRYEHPELSPTVPQDDGDEGMR